MPSVTVQFDKPRELKFDIPSCRVLENAMGGKPLGIIIGHLRQVSLDALIYVLHIGFRHEDTALTEAEVTSALNEYVDKGGRISVLATAIAGALLASGIVREAPDGDLDAIEPGLVELDRPRRIKFGLKAIRLLENAMGGMGIAAISEQISNGGINALVLALCVGLKTEDKDMTPNLTVKILERFVETGGSLRALGDVVRKRIDATGIFKNDEESLLDDESAEGNAKPELVTTT